VKFHKIPEHVRATIINFIVSEDGDVVSLLDAIRFGCQVRAKVELDTGSTALAEGYDAMAQDLGKMQADAVKYQRMMGHIDPRGPNAIRIQGPDEEAAQPAGPAADG
jgi:hypothetical protein